MFDATPGHSYELRVINYEQTGCTDSPNSCQATIPVTFRGSATGQNPTLTVTG